MILLYRHGELFEYNSIDELLLDSGFLIRLRISDSGIISLGDYVDTISYNLEKYTKQEALKDFINTRFSTVISIVEPHTKIYKVHD